MDELLEDLNPPQREAVLHQAGPLLVLAGAGSGKTRVVTRRIAALVKERGVESWRILAVTFTNKAAREMRERLQALLGPAANGLTVSTFHSSAAMILRREAQAAGLDRSFVIYDDGDQLQVVKRALREVGVEGTSLTPRELLSRIEAEKNAGRMPEQMKVRPDDPRGACVQRIYRKYQRLLHAANAVDFGDLLLLLVQLLRDNEVVRAHYQRRFTHILVDEFQDTNPVQNELLQLLAPPATTPNLVVVGDDDQSVYRWRGAEVDNILNFPASYPGCTVVKLEQNYRSDQSILEAAHAVISRNRRRMPKKLWSARARGEPLTLLVTRDERHEAQEVARLAHQLRMDGVCEYEQMAVFFRTNAQSRVLEETFRLMRVPYVLVSGRSFYDRAEIKDAASYLRLMVNPRSDADLARIINEPARGIGDTTLERVTAYASEAGLSLYEALEDPVRIDTLGSAAVKRLVGFRRLLERLVRFAVQTPDATAAAQFMLQESGLVAHFQALGTDEAMARAENLRELLSATQEFDRQRAARAGAAPANGGPAVRGTPSSSTVPPPAASVDLDAPPLAQGDLFAGCAPSPAGPQLAVSLPGRPASATPSAEPEDAALEFPPRDEQRSLEVEAPALQAFLEQVSLVGESDGDTGEGHGRVSLMTLHAAKGLEFDAVFLTGLEEGVFPHRRAVGPEASEDDMAEERRLCYVGFTRARRRLFCSLAQCRTLFGELRFNPPSRFLSEVPQELFDFASVPPAPRAGTFAPTVRRRPFAEEDDRGSRVERDVAAASDFDQRSEGDVRGRKVKHAQFGGGVVLDASGQGPNAKLTVRFDSVGTKTVIARFLSLP